MLGFSSLNLPLILNLERISIKQMKFHIIDTIDFEPCATGLMHVLIFCRAIGIFQLEQQDTAAVQWFFVATLCLLLHACRQYTCAVACTCHLPYICNYIPSIIYV